MSVVLVLLVLTVVTFLVYKYLKNRRFNSLLNKLPSPPGALLLGHAKIFKNKAELLDIITKHVDENDGIALFRVGPLVNYFAVADHELAKILCTSKNVQKSPRYKIFEKWLGLGMFTLEGEPWKKLRAVATPAFHINILGEFVDTFDSVTDIFIDRLKEKVGKDVDIYSYVNLCALDVISETAMGVPLNAQKNLKPEYVHSMHEMLRIIESRLSSPYRRFDWIFRLTEDFKKEKRGLGILKGYTNSIIDARVKTLSNGTAGQAPVKHEKYRRNLLDLFLEERGSQLTDVDVSNVVEGTMFAGHDTGASATSCILYLLAQHPEVQRRAFEEVREIFGNDRTRSCTAQDLQEMRYLEMVIKEGLRLYPPAVLISKQLMEDIEHNGYILPKGLIALVMLYSIHRREKYFPNPNEFDPERFASEVNILPFSYMPFGAGPRICIGQKFAMMEMKVIISKFLRNYEVLPTPGYKLELLPQIVLKPTKGGIQVRLKKRQY